jgi:hypothetical protein
MFPPTGFHQLRVSWLESASGAVLVFCINVPLRFLRRHQQHARFETTPALIVAASPAF